MTDYLPQITRPVEIAPASMSRPATPFTAVGRIERTTRKTSYQIAARTYLDALNAEGKAAVGRVKMRSALELEREALVGTARLGDEVSIELANGSGLAHQLVSELLAGTSSRIQRVLNDGVHRIESA